MRKEEENWGICTIEGCDNPASFKLRLYKDKDVYFLVCKEHFKEAHPDRVFDEDREEYDRLQGRGTD